MSANKFPTNIAVLLLGARDDFMAPFIKNHELFVAAFNKIKERHHDFHFEHFLFDNGGHDLDFNDDTFSKRVKPFVKCALSVS